MDLDEEILQRLTNTEDHLTERKSAPHRDQCTEAMAAFANSALPNKPGILYVGVDNAGQILQDKTPESWQHDITKWGNGCYPELAVIPRTLTKDDKEFLAIVVPLSAERPHFARPAFRRLGAKTIAASQTEIDEWIAQRNSKVKMILDWKCQLVGVSGPNNRTLWRGQHKVIACNPFYVTLESQASNVTWTHPLSAIDLKLNDTYTPNPRQLLLLLNEFEPDAQRRA